MSRGSKIKYRNTAYTSVWSATLKCSNSSRKTHGSKPKLILNVDQDIVIVSVPILSISTQSSESQRFTSMMEIGQLQTCLCYNYMPVWIRICSSALTDRQLSMWNILTASPISDLVNSEYICIPRLMTWISLVTFKKITYLILRNLFGLYLFSHQSCATGTLLLRK